MLDKYENDINIDDDHLTCNICGYKQYDPECVKSYKQANPNTDVTDIYYICGACQNILDNYDDNED